MPLLYSGYTVFLSVHLTKGGRSFMNSALMYGTRELCWYFLYIIVTRILEGKVILIIIQVINSGRLAKCPTI
jgi:hypothetical protein